MHILHIVGTISPAAGGPTEAIHMLVRHAPPGHTAEIATLDDPAAHFLADIAVPTHAFGSARRRWYSPRLLPWLRANRHRFDGVIVHGLWEYTGLAARLAFSGHVPTVVFPHGMLDPYFKRAHPAKHLRKQLYWLLSEFWNLRRATQVLFTTETERDLATSTFWPARWSPLVVPLGSEPPPADPATLLAAFQDHCPELAGKSFLLFLGRIDEKKGCDLLVRAFVAVVNEEPDLHLLMAGPDPTGWRHHLEALALPSPNSAPALSRIHWPGMLLGHAKWGALAACEAFILPSHQENFGIAVVEALATSKPVLISDQVNIAQEISADESGLVEPDTLVGTRNLLTRWLALSPTDRAIMAANAHRTFTTRYDMRRNTAAILQVFQPLSEAA